MANSNSSGESAPAQNQSAIAKFSTIAILLITILFVIDFITEISARQSHAAIFDSKVSSINQTLARINVNDPAHNTTKEYELKRSQVVVFGTLGSLLQNLQMVGAFDDCLTLNGIARIYTLVEFQQIPASIESVFDDGCRQITNERDKIYSPFLVSVRAWVPQSSKARTEILYSLIIVLCGGIGAIISGLRSAEFTTLRDLALGAAAGFVTYLALKGGKYIFLLHASEHAVLMNPFSGAFAGLIVGMFTERAHGLLSELIDGLATRIKAGFKG